MRPTPLLLTFAAILALPQVVQADNFESIDIGFTVEAHFNRSTLFSNEDHIIFPNAQRFDDSFPYPGFEGLGGLFSLLTEVRVGDSFGLETGASFGYNVLYADIRGQPTDITQNTLHVPLWFKFYAGEPGQVILAYEVFTFAIGAEHVIPFEPTLETRGTFIKGAESDAWWNALFSLGLEFRFPYSEKTKETILRFNLLRLAVRVDSLLNGRQVVHELPQQQLNLGSRIDFQLGVGLGLGFYDL